MKKIVFLSCETLSSDVVDDVLAIKELEQSGRYQVETHAWDAKVDWSRFDLAIIRTTWDYPQRHQEFLKQLQVISSQTKLLNSYEVVNWNYHKAYLQELASKGTKIVPTLFFSYPGELMIPDEWRGSKFILKPAISAGAFKTTTLTRVQIETNDYHQDILPGDWMLQPFLEEIIEGEISLQYFNKKFSHAIKKLPKRGDFRVQQEFGGSIVSFIPDHELLEFAEKALGAVPFDLLYARVDVIPKNGEYLLMELELIEPALYFEQDPESVKKFRQAISDAD